MRAHFTSRQIGLKSLGYLLSSGEARAGTNEQIMRRFATIPLLAGAFFATMAAAQPSGRVSPCPAEGDFQTLPAGIDVDSANRVWCWMKQQVHAPLALPPPPVFVGALRSNKYSVFVFPTLAAPDDPFSVEIASDTVQYEDPLFVLWALGHELAHGLFTLRPFGFKEQSTYPVAFPHIQHCDPEFQRVTRGAADVLWDIWHSSDQTSKMLTIDNDIHGRECAYASNLSRVEGGHERAGLERQ